MFLAKHVLVVGSIVSALASYTPESKAQMRLWGTYYGGSVIETVRKVAVDAGGNIYAVGATMSPNGIATPNGFDSIKEPSPNMEFPETSGYIAKFNTNGVLIWATYYGDSGTTHVHLFDLGLDASGNVYVLGKAECPASGLATAGAFKSQCEGSTDMYLAKFDPAGKRLWGTYFGGTGSDLPGGLSVTPSGAVYLIGSTSSQGIASMQSPDKTLRGDQDAVIARFTTQGTLLWTRYFGGDGYESGFDIACRAPNVYTAE